MKLSAHEEVTTKLVEQGMALLARESTQRTFTTALQEVVARTGRFSVHNRKDMLLWLENFADDVMVAWEKQGICHAAK